MTDEADSRGVVLDIVEEAGPWRDAVPQADTLLRRAIHAALDAVPDGSGGQPLELCIVLADDGVVRALNRDFRGKDRPTNVLSFPAGEPDAPDGMARLLGDIVLSYDTCAREADEQGKSLQAHLSHLTVHGVFHLLGYDHMDDAEAEEMEALEARALAAIGVADPYVESVRDDNPPEAVRR
jgi:probable rRNA maturation factor